MKLLVVTATLGRSPYLSETVKSIDALTIPFSHVIVAPAEMIADLETLFPARLVIAEGGNSRGLYSALNQGIKACPSDWTHFTYLNDDDVFLSDFSSELERAIALGADFFWGRCLAAEVGTGRRWVFPIETNGRRLGGLFHGGIVGIQQPGVVISRRLWDFVGPFDQSLRLNADMALILAAASLAQRYYCSRKTVSMFRVHAGQLSAAKGVVDQENIRVRDKLKVRAYGFQLWWACLSFRLRNVMVYVDRFVRLRSIGRFY